MQVRVREKEREAEVRRVVEEATGGSLPLVKEAMGKRVWRAGDLFVKAHTPWRLSERLKQLFIGTRARREFERSLEVQNRGIRCASPVGYVVFRRTGTSFLVVEAEEGTDVGDALRQTPPAERASFLRSLARFVRQMHAAGIFHGDLHPGNILSHNGVFCLLDTVKCRMRKSLSLQEILRDLAQLAWGVWSVAGEEAAQVLVREYWGNDKARIDATMRRARRYGQRRLRSRSKRCVKKSTRFVRIKTAGWRILCRREYADLIDHYITAATHPEGIFCKRRVYRGLWGALRLLLGLGRLLRAWKAAHRLQLLGVPVVEHIAYARRLGLLRSEERLFMERAECNLQQFLWRCVFERRADEAVAIGEKAASSVRKLLLAGVWHGDLKSQNLLVKDGEVVVGDTESVRRRGLTDWRVARMLSQIESSLPRCLPARSRLRVALGVLRGTGFWERRRGILTQAAALAERRRLRWAEQVARHPIRSSSCESSTSTATTD